MKSYLYNLIFLTLFLFLSVAASGNGKKFIVIIDPGHGGTDPGAVGAISYEKDINLDVAKKLGDLIKNNHKDVKVLYTRTDDKKLKLKDRAEFANRQNADLFISIHTNSMENKRTKGTETYIYGIPSEKKAIDVEKRENVGNIVANGNETSNENFQKNRLLAQEIQNAFKKGNRINKGVKKARFVVLKHTKMPAVLVEIGYISNKSEEKYMNSVAGQKAIAQSIYTAFSNYRKNSTGKTTVDKKGSKTQLAEKKKDHVSAETSKNVTQAKKKTVYKVQFLLSDRKLPNNSSKFKGLSPVEFYIENGSYKYTYGNASNFKEIEKSQKEVKKLFKDAFIVIFEDGKRIDKK